MNKYGIEAQQIIDNLYKLGWTGKHIAEVIGVHHTTIYRIRETGSTRKVIYDKIIDYCQKNPYIFEDIYDEFNNKKYTQLSITISKDTRNKLDRYFRKIRWEDRRYFYDNAVSNQLSAHKPNLSRNTKRIHDHFGRSNQLQKLIEEMQELKEAIETGVNKHIDEELADVTLLIRQLCNEKIENIVKFKISRTLKRMNNGYYKKG